MKLPILFIGPMYTGKSTLATLLAKRLQVPETPVDYVAGYYYVKQDIDLEKLAQVMGSENVQDYIDFVRPYELNALRSICNEFPNSIISSGAGHTYYTDQIHVDELLKIREQTQNIFLILPSENEETSQGILRDRMLTDRRVRESETKLKTREIVNNAMIASTSNRALAHHVIYTEGKTSEECLEEIINLLV